MANTFAPFGFSQYFGGTGGAPTFAQTRMRAAYNAGAIYFGDAVVPVTSTATGYIIQATASTVALAGIFVGCTYLSTSMKRRVWSNYWPGSDTAYDVDCYVINDPNAQFVVQGNSTTFNIGGTLSSFTTSPIGQYAQLAVGTGNTANGISGMYLNALGTTVTYPFIVTDRVIAPPGANGTDPTVASNYVVVGFNNALTRTNGAGPTGIS